MPYPKTSQGYPSVMKHLTRTVGMERQVVRIECPSTKEARSLRSRFYQLYAALRRDAERAPKWVDAKEVLELTNASFNCEMVVEGSTLVIRPRDASPTSEILSRATISGAPPVKTLNIEEQQSLDRLLGKLNMDIKDLE